LLQGQRQPVQLAGESLGRVSFVGLGILAAATLEEERGRVLDGQPFQFDRLEDTECLEVLGS
jgi:hypothetical protein